MAISPENIGAVVTGASKGIGRGIALALARHGYNVAVNYHSDRDGAVATLHEIKALGANAVAVQGDVGKSDDVQRLMDAAVKAFGQVGIWINNAGIQTWKPLLDLKESEWDKVIQTNLKGAFLGIKTAAEHMKLHGWGRIINIGSGCNKVAFPGLGDYTASKGGIEMLTKVAACELGPLGITVNCVAPGAIEIERTKNEAGDYAGTWGSITPMRRIGVPEDVANAVLFFVKEDSEFVSGQTLWVDGALLAKGPWPYTDKR